MALALALPTMETFTLLRFWRGGGGGNANIRPASSPASANVRTSAPTTTTAESEDDEGSFFDLEFSVQNDAAASGNDSTSDSGDEDDKQGELNFAVSSPLSPSVVIASSSSPDADPKSSQLVVYLLKSATKLRVFMLGGLKKPKSLQSDPNAASSPTQNQNHSNKLFIKLRVKEVAVEKGGSPKSPRSEEEPAVAAADDKKFSKETVQKYINSKIKPLYVRVSKRYGERLRFSGQLKADCVAGADVISGDEAPAGESARDPAVAKAKLPAGLGVVRKRLGKSMSASAVVASVASPPPAQQRRDDSLLQQQDGIQSAIAHCKRSLNAASNGKIFQPDLSPQGCFYLFILLVGKFLEIITYFLIIKKLILN